MTPSLPAADVASGFALDQASLAGLKRQAKDAPRAALSAAVGQFEALFVQTLLKSMRDALPKDGLLGGDAARMYTGMLDQQFAQRIARQGIGLGRVLERQLAPMLAGRDGDAAPPATGGTDAPPPLAAARALRGAAPGAPRIAADAPGAARSLPRTSDAGGLPAHVHRFVESMRPYAEAAARMVGLPADVLLAQAGLETGWGRSQPRAANGEPSHNLFGIKAGKGWTGSSALATTTEYVAGAVVRTVDRFRAYASYTDAFADFGRLISGNPRYAEALSHAGDPQAYARALQRGGYATDPHYAEKLARTIALVASTHPAPQVLAARADNRGPA
jgi:flagellar protein FlgJ